MGHYSIITVNHDNFHEDTQDPELHTKVKNLVMGNHKYGVSEGHTFGREVPRSMDVVYMNHMDASPVLWFLHGAQVEELATPYIRGPIDRTGEDVLVAALKARGYVVYKKEKK